MTEAIEIPDIGDYQDVEVIEVLVSVGDTIEKEQNLITIETDKASMEIPAPKAGLLKSVDVQVGDKVSQGSVIAHISVESSDTPEEKIEEPQEEVPKEPTKELEKKTNSPEPSHIGPSGKVYASPGVRRFARELGVDLAQITGTGPKGRILKENIQQYVKQSLASGGGVSGGDLGFNLPKAQAIDFSAFGDISQEPLSRIKKISGPFLHRNWVSIPHVTQFDEADITELEAFRQGQKTLAEKQGVRLTPLVFMMKAVVSALREFPHFNASLDSEGTGLIIKHYYHIGIAVDTPQGLVVPVVRDVDQKGLFGLARELGEISQRARDGKLGAKEMQGGCFTISSLGGIGGSGFTPIINAPELAILGVSKASKKPVYDLAGELQARLMVPLCLSYDHRVIDGADGARFTKFLAHQLSDIRRLLL